MKKLIAAVLLLAATTAGAQNFYATGSLGQSKLGIDKAEIDSQVAAVFGPLTSSSLDATGTAWKVGAGYQAHRNLALEAGWASLGEANYKAAAGGATIAETVNAAGPYATLLLQAHPAQMLTAFLKAGVTYQQVDAKVTASGPGGSITATAKSSRFSPTYGAGVMLNISKTISLRVDYDRYSQIGGDETGKGDVDTVTAGLVVRF